MKLSLCNEVVRELPFREQCQLAAALGYDGLEIAPFTLSPRPHRLEGEEIARMRSIAQDAGIELTSLHWLLIAPEGLSITSPDDQIRSRTEGVMKDLVSLCADLGGTCLVHGSPAQRNIEAGQDRDETFRRVVELFQSVAERARSNNVVYCIEPLTSLETNFINTLQEASALVRAVGSPAFKTMLDCKAARGAESAPLDVLMDAWLPTGNIAHVHLNDRNRQGPGQGRDGFAEVLDALHRHDYQGVVAVEPFDYQPDGPTSAARAAGFVQGLREGLGFRRG